MAWLQPLVKMTSCGEHAAVSRERSRSQAPQPAGRDAMPALCQLRASQPKRHIRSLTEGRKPPEEGGGEGLRAGDKSSRRPLRDEATRWPSVPQLGRGGTELHAAPQWEYSDGHRYLGLQRCLWAAVVRGHGFPAGLVACGRRSQT